MLGTFTTHLTREGGGGVGVGSSAVLAGSRRPQLSRRRTRTMEVGGQRPFVICTQCVLVRCAVQCVCVCEF